MKNFNKYGARKTTIDGITFDSKKEAEKVLKEKYGIGLTVLVYPDCMPDVIEQLQNAGFQLKFLKDVMPDYDGYHSRKVDLKYEIPYDGHPTAKTHKLIADYTEDLFEAVKAKYPMMANALQKDVELLNWRHKDFLK